MRGAETQVMSDEATGLLRVRGLSVRYPFRGSGRHRGETAWVQAVDQVDLDLDAGQTLGLVGESGCGKTSLGRAILQLVRPASGHVWLEGRDLVGLSGRALRQLRREIQIIFQDPYASLNPRMAVGEIIGEPLRIHALASRREIEVRVASLLDQVGLSHRVYRRYPHELSGGQRQRVGIARAISAGPKLIVCDEPISALDVSIQAQILNLLQELQRELGVAYLFIAHDLAAVRHISHRIAVMYLGKIVEEGPAHEICQSPHHPYTQALMEAAPVPDPEIERGRERKLLSGEIPSPVAPPLGCAFHPRCTWAEERCVQQAPPLRRMQTDRQVACHLVKVD